MIRHDKIRRADAQTPAHQKYSWCRVQTGILSLIPLGMQARQDENAGVQRHARQRRPDTDKDDHAN